MVGIFSLARKCRSSKLTATAVESLKFEVLELGGEAGEVPDHEVAVTRTA